MEAPLALSTDPCSPPQKQGTTRTAGRSRLNSSRMRHSTVAYAASRTPVPWMNITVTTCLITVRVEDPEAVPVSHSVTGPGARWVSRRAQPARALTPVAAVRLAAVCSSSLAPQASVPASLACNTLTCRTTTPRRTYVLPAPTNAVAGQRAEVTQLGYRSGRATEARWHREDASHHPTRSG